MKKITVLFVLSILLVFSVSINASNGFEFIGGGIYTTVDSDELNDEVVGVNLILNLLKEELYYDGFKADVSKMDKIDSAFGFYAGGLLPVNDNFKFGGYYERFKLSSEANLTVPSENADININIDLPVNGIVGTARYSINKFVAINGGVGFYFGEFSESIKFYEDGREVKVEDLSLDHKVDINGFGFKFGADINYPINEQTSINGGANYRILSLTPKDEDKYGDDEINLNGFEIRGGIAYKF